jgi:hypothetical protein
MLQSQPTLMRKFLGRWAVEFQQKHLHHIRERHAQRDSYALFRFYNGWFRFFYRALCQNFAVISRMPSLMQLISNSVGSKRQLSGWLALTPQH